MRLALMIALAASLAACSSDDTKHPTYTRSEAATLLGSLFVMNNRCGFEASSDGVQSFIRAYSFEGQGDLAYWSLAAEEDFKNRYRAQMTLLAGELPSMVSSERDSRCAALQLFAERHELIVPLKR